MKKKSHINDSFNFFLKKRKSRKNNREETNKFQIWSREAQFKIKFEMKTKNIEEQS